MIAGLWMTPAVLAGLFAILWVTSWLERQVAPRPVGGGVKGPQVVEMAFALISARADSLGMVGAGPAPIPGVPPLPKGRSQPCTSEQERSY